MQLDAIKIIADQHAEIERLQRRVDELLDAANIAVEVNRSLKRQLAAAQTAASAAQDMASRLRYQATTGQ